MLSEIGNLFAVGYECPWYFAKKDPETAAELYRLASELGNGDGAYNLALCYQYGIGVQQDQNKASELYSRASMLGREFINELSITHFKAAA